LSVKEIRAGIAFITPQSSLLPDGLGNTLLLPGLALADGFSRCDMAMMGE
jgi:hypothetical protein